MASYVNEVPSTIDGLINIIKMRMYAETILEIQQYQDLNHHDELAAAVPFTYLEFMHSHIAKAKVGCLLLCVCRVCRVYCVWMPSEMSVMLVMLTVPMMLLYRCLRWRTVMSVFWSGYCPRARPKSPFARPCFASRCTDGASGREHRI